jgi:antitoxin ParD1/3/4
LAKFATTDILFLNLRSRSNMPTRNISLTNEQNAFVEKLVKAGEYQNVSEALRDALRALEQRRREEADRKFKRAGASAWDRLGSPRR